MHRKIQRSPGGVSRAFSIIAACALTALVAASNSSLSEPLISTESIFELSICNRTAKPIATAILSKHKYGEEKWILGGWHFTSPNNCNVMGEFQRGYIYLYANQKDSNAFWGGKDRYVCVADRAMERVVFENERCLVGEANRGFVEKLVKADKFTWTLTEK